LVERKSNIGNRTLLETAAFCVLLLLLLLRNHAVVCVTTA
jgi:hypothetical protein